MLTKHRKAGRALAAAGAAVATTAAVGVATAPTANAATCNSGSACVYWSNADGGSVLKYQNAGNATISLPTGVYGGWVRNNGVRYPGADHITVTTRLGTVRWAICLHYGALNFTPGSGVNTAARLEAGEVVTGWRWRGECAPGEDRWHSY
ncbi:hypothetical protein [Kribbella shirazensis]|uniref:Peptidase inhibitor family I36 n=1 Tax=Kribbella shirazensis TaxID=1105143 RepID=A0A7X5V7Y1_9ACTN|nr:hypothetical protein [Kribbella shirazensis]NIK55906.1 hypothetical protein [Kribbella shirazensis]